MAGSRRSAKKEIPIDAHVVYRSQGDRPLIERGEGIYLYDREGHRYLDAASGAAVANLGHGVAEVVERMTKQAREVSFAAPSAFAHETQVALGKVISERAPGTLKNNCRTWFNVTGTDAVDDALRLARQYFTAKGQGTKHLAIARWQSFHGNSIGMAGVHGHTARRQVFSPMYVNMPHIPPAFCYRCPFKLNHPECDLACAQALETEICQQGPENVAAFVAEPVVGAALAAVPAPEGYFERIREICDTYDVLLICDEVMSGWGRCGHWFAIEAWEVTPDIIALGKGLGAGYTSIAATIAHRELWDEIEAGGGTFRAGHTMNQNPVSCATALAVLDYIEEHDLLTDIREIGAVLGKRLQALHDHEHVGDVRGMGMLWGIELVRDKEKKSPFDPKQQVSNQIQHEALQRGLVVYPCTGSIDGIAGDMILIAPPFITTEAQVEVIFETINITLGTLSSAHRMGSI